MAHCGSGSGKGAARQLARFTCRKTDLLRPCRKKNGKNASREANSTLCETVDREEDEAEDEEKLEEDVGEGDRDIPGEAVQDSKMEATTEGRLRLVRM